MPDLPDDQTRYQEESRSTPADTTTREEMEPSDHGFGHRPPRIRKVHSRGSLCGPVDKTGAFCPVYKGGHRLQIMRGSSLIPSSATMGYQRSSFLDRDPRFTSKFWTTLFELLGTDLRFSTAFHPQMDGQSEVMIRTLENFLRPYVERNPASWVKQLPLAEFAANNAVNASTGYTPFYLEEGQDPTVPMSLLDSTVQTRNQAVNDMVDRMKVGLRSAWENIQTAQERMKRAVDKSCREETFSEGDEVTLSTRHLKQVSSHLPVKLRRRWVGPFVD